MSHKATTWAFGVRGLKPGAKIVLLALADCHNPSHGCFPSQAYLADVCEMSPRSVQNHLQSLEEAGLIRREAVRRKGAFAHNRYVLGFEMCENGHAQNLPTAKSASGKKQHSPYAKNDSHRTQNLPTNLVIRTRKEPVSEKAFFEFSEEGSGGPSTHPPDDTLEARRKAAAEIMAASGFAKRIIAR